MQMSGPTFGDSDIGLFLLIGTLICAAMAIVSAFRYKSRGISAYIMSLAFVVLGATMLLDRLHAPQPVLIGGCALLVIILGIDFAARSAHNARKDSKR